MRKGNFTNEELDAIGREVLRAAALPAERVDGIADSPFLFRKTMARIEAGRRDDAAKSSRRLLPVALGGFAAVVFAVTALALFIPFINTPEVVDVNLPVTEIAIPVAALPPAAEAAAATLEPAREKRVEKAHFRPSERKSSGKLKIRKTGPESKKQVPMIVEREFIAFATVQDAEDAKRDAHVIRVEMPPASLFALGANVPLENGEQTIKADLLVGPDGVARAIRLVE